MAAHPFSKTHTLLNLHIVLSKNPPTLPLFIQVNNIYQPLFLPSGLTYIYGMGLLLFHQSGASGAVSRDFLEFFLFHESKPSGPLINRLKWFCLKVCFHGEICKKFDSAQANTAQSRKLKCSQIQNWLTLRGVKQIFLIFENLNFQGI